MPLERYEILELIGEGVSAKVYKAVDKQTRSLVAVKVLSPHLQTDDISIERFRREIQITRHLQHPQIVSIYDLVQDGETWCLVMELVDGQNLKDFIRLETPLPLETVLSMLRQILDVLSVCHQGNVVHRDLKPQNVIIDAQRRARLLDFGIARMATLSDLTQTGTAIGSPEYMAPELFASSSYDPRTDLYAVGVIAFEMLAGEPPFRADSIGMLYHQHAHGEPARLSRYRDDVPVWLQQVVDRLLAKKAVDRYQCAEEALADLESRRVIARELPVLEKRECIQCGGRTPVELPLCLQCGYNTFVAAQPGGQDVYCSRDEDPEKLAEFVRNALHADAPPRRPRQTLLFSELDELAARVLKTAAQRHGIFLSARPHSQWADLKKAVPLLLLTFSATMLFRTTMSTVSVVGLYAYPSIVIAWIALLVCASWGLLRVYQAQEVYPLYGDLQAQLRAKVREYEWMRALAPVLAAPLTESARSFIAQMVEKYCTLLRFGDGIHGSTGAGLEQLLERTALVAAQVSEVDRCLDEPRFAALAADYAGGVRDVEWETDSTRRADLRLRREAARAILEARNALEDRRTALVNRLIYLQYVFNRMLGRALVLRSPFDQQDFDLIASCSEDLLRELSIARQVHQELVAA